MVQGLITMERPTRRSRRDVKEMMAFSFLSGVLLLIVLSSGCAHIQYEDKGRNTYAYGVIAEKENRIDDAISYYRETINKAGEDSYLYGKLGNLYLRKQDISSARKCFFRAVRLEPKRQEALFGLGLSYLLEKNYNLAALYMERGLALDKENHSARMILCDLYAGMNRLQDAARHYQYLIEVFPENYLFHYNYGNILERLGKNREAEEEYTKSVELAHFFWKGYFSLGLLYDKLGMKKKSIEFFEKAVSLNPSEIISYSLLASAYYSEGNKEKAKHYIEEAIRNGINSAQFYQFLGIIYMDESAYDKAEAVFRKSIEIEDISGTRFYLGVLYDKTGEREKMEAEMKKAIELDHNNAAALNYLGYTYLIQDRNIQEAYKLIKKACEIEPDNGAFLDSLGWAYYKMGKYHLAVKYLEKAVEKEKDAEVYEHLGYVYLKLKEYERALLWFIKAYEINRKQDIQKIMDEIRKHILENGTD
ncbi:MAG: tetratricopeptide repeat protein [Candidatus Omnitrophica bacterium]|nr:tetratricopeptide repeat protein [Candidatus Omnitrophota bacterium]